MVRTKKKIKRKNLSKDKGKVASSQQVPVKYLLQHLNCPISILDSRKRKYIYVNPQFIQMTGLTAEELYSVNLSEFLTRIHAKDFLVVLNDIAEQVRHICSEYIHKKKQKLTYTINYRFKKNDGKYIHVMAQNTVLEWNEKNKRSVTLSIYTDISSHKNDPKIVLTVNALDESDGQWKLILTKEFIATPEMLSEREKEVMTLIVQENTAGEISKKMGIAFYTVRSHWRNILNKTGCKSQKELKKMAQEEGWV